MTRTDNPLPAPLFPVAYLVATAPIALAFAIRESLRDLHAARDRVAAACGGDDQLALAASAEITRRTASMALLDAINSVAADVEAGHLRAV